MPLKYVAAQRKILSLAADKGYDTQTRFPDESELARLTGFSGITVRRAMKELERAGMIRRVRGHGSFLRQEIEKSPRLETILFVQTYATTAVTERLLFPLRQLCRMEAYGFRFLHAEEPDTVVADEIARCAGVFLTGRVTREWLNLVEGLGKPCVVIGSPEQEEAQAVQVAYDWLAMAEGVTSRLIEAGCRRIAMLVPPESYRPSASILNGYRQALENAGLPFDERLVVVAERGKNGTAALKLMGKCPTDNTPRFDATLCNSDAYPYLASAFLGTGRDASATVFGVMDDAWELHKHEIPLVNNIVTGYFPEGLAQTAMKAMRYRLGEPDAASRVFAIAPEFDVTLNRFRKVVRRHAL